MLTLGRVVFLYEPGLDDLIFSAYTTFHLLPDTQFKICIDFPLSHHSLRLQKVWYIVHHFIRILRVQALRVNLSM